MSLRPRLQLFYPALKPALVFLAFLILVLTSESLLRLAGIATTGWPREAVFATGQVGIWIAGAVCIIRLINIFFWDRIVSPSIGRPVPRLLKDFLAFVIFALAVTGIIGTVYQQSIAAIWATSGALGVVLGLALKGIILDVFTGLAINIDRTYQIGDWLEVHNRDVKAPIYGKVVEINWRTTRIELENKNIVILPNSSMGVTAITNVSLPEDLARFEINITLDYSIPLDRAMRILLAGAKGSIGKGGPVESPEPKVLVGDATEIGVRYRIRYWIRVNQVSPSTGRSTVTASILDHLSKAGVTPASQRQDVFHAPMPTRNFELTQQGLTGLLAKVDLFEKSLRKEELEELAEMVRMRLYKAQETIIRQGEAGASMFIVAEGLAYVYVDSEKGGEKIKVSQTGPGHTFGEMSLLTGEPRTATVITATDVVAFELSKENLHVILERRPEVAEHLSAVVVERRLALSKAQAGVHAGVSLAEKQTMLGKMKRFFSGIFK